MANTYELIVKTVDQSSRSLRNIEKSLASVERRSKTVNTAIKAVGAGIAAVFAARGVKSIIDVTARFEDLRTTLNSVSGSARQGAQAFQFVQRFATRTQFGVEALTKTYIQLAANGIQPTERLLTLFTDTAAVTTDQLGALEAMTKLFSRAAAGAGLSVEDLDILAERGIPVYKILADRIGVTRDNLTEFAKTAGGTTKILDTLQTGLEDTFGGATERRAGNLSTIISNLQIAIKNAADEFGTGMAPAIKRITERLTEFINGNKGFFATLGDLAGRALDDIADGIGYVARELGLIEPGGLQRALAGVLRGMANLAEGMASAIDTMSNAIAGAANLIQRVVETLLRFANQLPGIDLNIEFGKKGESQADTIRRLVEERFGPQIAAERSVDTVLLAKQQQRLVQLQSQAEQMERVFRMLRMSMQQDFPDVSVEVLDSMLLKNEDFQRITGQYANLRDDIREQQALVDRMREDGSVAAQAIIQRESQNIANQIANGDLTILSQMEIGTTNFSESAADRIAAIRKYADDLEAAADAAKKAGAGMPMNYGVPLSIPAGGDVSGLLPPPPGPQGLPMDTGTPLQIPAGGAGLLLPPRVGGGGDDPVTAASLYKQATEAIEQAGIEATATAGAIRQLETAFANGSITLEQLKIGMESIGGDFELLQDKSIMMGMKISEAFTSAGDSLARGLASGIVRGEGIMNSFKNFMQSILEEILYQIIQQAFIKPMIASMTQGFSQAFSAFGAGGSFGSGMGLLGSLFGGGGGLFGMLGGLFFANGGVVPGLPTSGDSVPAMLTPGEVILNKQQQAQVLEGGGGDPIQVNFNISAIDTQSGTEFILQNKKQITSVIQQAYNTRGQSGPLG